jgi:hypothetical protein
MSDNKEMSTDTLEAIAQSKAADLRKKVNAASWNDNMEKLMKMWGEKAAGLRFMHNASAGSWKKFSDKLSITSILVTGIASTLSLVSTSIDDDDTKNSILFTVGGIGLVSTLLQSFKKFYNAEEKSADHNAVAKQFGSFYRYITLQLGMTREDRDPSDMLSSWALKEYERLQQEAPNLGGSSIALFKQLFDKNIQSFPDIAEDQFVINIYKPEEEKDEEDKDDDTEEEVIENKIKKLINPKSVEVELVSSTTGE